MKKCPLCAEEILDEAIVCKHCHQYVGAEMSTANFKMGEFLNKSQWLVGFGWMVVCLSGFVHWSIVIFGSIGMLHLATILDKYKKVINK